jgi:hypothetical protein
MASRADLLLGAQATAPAAALETASLGPGSTAESSTSALPPRWSSSSTARSAAVRTRAIGTTEPDSMGGLLGTGSPRARLSAA